MKHGRKIITRNNSQKNDMKREIDMELFSAVFKKFEGINSKTHFKHNKGVLEY